MAQLEFDYLRELALEAARNDALRNEIARDPVAALTKYQRKTLPREVIVAELGLSEKLFPQKQEDVNRR